MGKESVNIEGGVSGWLGRRRWMVGDESVDGAGNSVDDGGGRQWVESVDSGGGVSG